MGSIAENYQQGKWVVIAVKFDTYYNNRYQELLTNLALLYIMKNKSVLAIFIVALAAVVSGVFYFGGALNQQASVANLVDKPKSGTVQIPVDSPIEPVIPSTPPKGVLDELKWRKLCLDKKPHIEVLSPNGGEVFTTGQKIPVTWRSCNMSAQTGVWIDLIHTVNDPAGREWGFSTKNDGYELVNPPTNHGAYTTGKYYKVLVYPHDTMSGTVRDQSDNSFTINTMNPVDVKYVASNTMVTQSSAGTGSQGTFSITFDITGHAGDDVYIDKTCSSIARSTPGMGTALATSELSFVIEDGNGVIPHALNATCSLAAVDAIDFPKSFRVNDESTERFTLTVIAKPNAAGSYRMKIVGIGYNTTSGDIEGNQVISDRNGLLIDLKTQYVSMN